MEQELAALQQTSSSSIMLTYYGRVSARGRLRNGACARARAHGRV